MADVTELLWADLVAEIVTHRSESAFVSLLKFAYPFFGKEGFEGQVASRLRDRPELIAAWETWSADQRWTPSAYLEGTEVGFYDTARRQVRQHTEPAAAAADFIHRLSAWVIRREIVETGF